MRDASRYRLAPSDRHGRYFCKRNQTINIHPDNMINPMEAAEITCRLNLRIRLEDTGARLFPRLGCRILAGAPASGAGFLSSLPFD